MLGLPSVQTIINTCDSESFLPQYEPEIYQICKLASGKPCFACTELAAFDEQSSWQNEDAELTEERNLLVSKINQRHDPFYHYLPFELVSKIFMIYYQDLGYESAAQMTNWQDAHAESPLLLASVCSTWRQIAFDTASLWASLQIVYHPGRNLYPKLAVQWLGRAGRRPLFLRLIFPDHYEYAKHSRRSIAPLFEAVKRFSDQWKGLNIFMPSKLCKVFLAGPPLETPLLETLQLDITDVRYVDDTLIVDLITPRLQNLRMSRLWLATLGLDWANLTYVRFEQPCIDEIFVVLHRAPRLITLDFNYICDTSTVYTIPNLTHKSLRTLKMWPKDFMEDDIMYTFFDNLSCPSLKCLIYDFKRSLMPLDLDNISRFLTCATSGITYLSLQNIESHCISSSTIIHILLLLPTITELHLKCWEGGVTGIRIPETLFSYLELSSRPGSAVSFLPKLQVLVYRGLKPTRFAWKELEPALLQLALALEYPMKFNTPGPRPLHTVRFTLVDNPICSDAARISPVVLRTFLKIQQSLGIDLRISEEITGKNEFNNFPAHWFNSDEV